MGYILQFYIWLINTFRRMQPQVGKWIVETMANMLGTCWALNSHLAIWRVQSLLIYVYNNLRAYVYILHVFTDC